MESINKIFEELIKFRSLMGLSLSKDDIKYIWGKKYFKSLDRGKLKMLKEEQNNFVKEKIKICENNISKFKIFNWVQFVGISGSVAAGFAKENDDVDVFVVVRDGTMWLYRGMIVFLNIFHNKIRSKRHRNIKNKLCLNLICEERDLEFENDIFNFHEVMFLKPIYNEKYINYIYSRNDWLETQFYVKKEDIQTRVISKKEVFILIRAINYLAFLSQLIFMGITGHNPDTERLRKNYKEGKIEFFEYDYKKKMINNYLKEFKSIN